MIRTWMLVIALVYCLFGNFDHKDIFVQQAHTLSEVH